MLKNRPEQNKTHINKNGTRIAPPANRTKRNDFIICIGYIIYIRVIVGVLGLGDFFICWGIDVLVFRIENFVSK